MAAMNKVAVVVTVDSEEAKKRLDGVALIGHFLGTEEFAAYWKNAETIIEPLIVEAKKQ